MIDKFPVFAKSGSCRLIGQSTIHAVLWESPFHIYARTACGLRVETRGNTVTMVPDDNGWVFGEPVNEIVDCMTCLVNTARKQDTIEAY